MRYMTQFAYRTEAWEALRQHPDRLAGRLKNALEDELGGKLLDLYFYFGLGEWDGYLTFEAEDDVRAQAILNGALAGSRHIDRTRTAKLLTPDELGDALSRAAKVQYGPPPSS